MRIFCALCGLFLAVAIVNCSPIVKRETEDTLKELDPLNEVYVFEIEDEAPDGENGENREKRKIGVKLGVTNGVINFVFGKLDSLLDAKTRALTVLDESNKAKNAAFGIDPNHSATTQFISSLVSQKIRAATGSIGPVINSATTLVSGTAAGLTNALVSKVAPLSSLSGGITGGGGAGAGVGIGVSTGDATTGAGGAVGSAILGNLLTAGINTLSTLSQSSGTTGGTNAGASIGASGSSGSGNANAGAGINLGGFANIGGNTAGITTTTEDTPVFDRTRVSLEIPSAAFGTGFTLLTNVSKVLNSVILNSARRTQTLLEVFKPFFRGTFAIKGLPSDNPH